MAQIIVAFIAIFLLSVSAVDLPEFLHVCNRNDPNINTCISESVMHIRPYLVEGVPDYNIPSLEPLLLKELVASESQNGIRISGNNVKAYGASDFTVGRMMVDMDKLEFDFDIHLPHLYFVGEYEIDGKVLLLPIRGNGQMYGNITGVIGSVIFKATSDPDDAGVRQFRIIDFKLKVTVADGNLKLDNLFGGDGIIGDVINNAINSNFDTFIRELMPSVESALGRAFEDIASGIVRVFTFDQLFPN
ncbi:hypothetical protein PV325_009774 [Microctonus aethiopoides]|uniref:Protein takeout n=1 Tax=Microctonus aethiopoides TaxID=144406 RepID=A0AA39F7D0_9HYME|nr:hypothetical protein PV325_009774 [Microctonus aethiopoides]KAK0164302.1 hypothetical protein PV328_002946 [Microctonus aethiopoides]